MKILVINGVNLNMLGQRDSAQYGSMTLGELNQYILDYFIAKEIEINFVQSNHEGVIVEYLQNAKKDYFAVVLNAGAFTHYSYAIRDAIECASLPVVEVHLSNIYQREPFRKVSVIEEVCCAKFYGDKDFSYINAINLLIEMFKEKNSL